MGHRLIEKRNLMWLSTALALGLGGILVVLFMTGGIFFPFS